MRKILLNNFGLTMVTTMEGEHLMVKAIFDRISPDITGYYEMDTQCARSRILLYTLTLFKKDFPNIFNGLNLPRYDV